MTAAAIRRAWAAVAREWNGFFHRPEPVAGLALFRILFGLVLLLNWALLAPDVLTWLGERGVLTAETARRMTGPRLSVFPLLPPGDAWVLAVFAITVLATLGLTLGYRTRTCAVVAFLAIVSIHHRNQLVLHSGDTLLRLISFLLIFSPAGDALSVDRWRRRRAGAAEPAPVLRALWTQRLIQLQVAVLYFATAWWKLSGGAWRDGTAVYYILRLVDFQRFPLPLESLWVDSLAATRLLTWAALAVEFAMALLVWVPAFRYPVLIAGACLHLGLEYTLNIPVFQLLMLACLVLFVPPADVLRAGTRLRGWLGAGPKAPYSVRAGK